MKQGDKVFFVVNSKLKEGIVMRNENGKVLVKTKRRRYHLPPYQLARKEEHNEKR